MIDAPISISPKEYALSTEFAPLNEPLGAIVVAFAQLESKLTMSIDALLGVEYPAGVALEDLMQSPTARIKLFHTLAVLKTSGIFLKKLEGLRGKLDKCNGFQNNLIHGSWTGVRSNGSFTKVRYKADKGLKPIESTINVTIDDLWSAHELIFGTSLELETWRFAYNHRDRPELWPASWRDK
jgi:hypothetical protein